MRLRDEKKSCRLAALLRQPDRRQESLSFLLFAVAFSLFVLFVLVGILAGIFTCIEGAFYRTLGFWLSIL